MSGAPGTGTAVTSGTESYLYDDLDRPIDVTYSDGGHVAYTYDANGNRLNQLDGTALTTYTYDNADQLATVSGASTHAYNYDANGNRTAVDADTFAYDWQDRLVEATVGGATVSYGYDGQDIRVSRTVNGITTTQLLDRSWGLPEFVQEGWTQFVQGPAGVVKEDDGTATYPIHDGSHS